MKAPARCRPETAWSDFFDRELAALEERGLLRDLYLLPGADGQPSGNGRTVMNFSSNDYLGLAADPRLKQAAIAAVQKSGCGATASRLMAGHFSLHEELEHDLARMMETEAALVFGSGFLTNLGVIPAVAGQGDVIFSDWLNHASIIDGTRLSRARCFRYRHKDLDHLESLLIKPVNGKRIIISESVFSMDGDVAPVAGLYDLAQRYEALLYIDEAHAIGVMGRNGAGVCRIPGHEIQPGIIVGTLSKSLGGYGGFVACSRSVRKYLINRARTFIFSTGLPPACLGSARAAVSIVTAHPGMGATLLGMARSFRDMLVRRGLNIPEFESQILPILVGDNRKTVRFAKLLQAQGFMVMAVRPPSVPPGTSRIRLSLTLSMTEEVLAKAAEAIAGAAAEAGIV